MKDKAACVALSFCFTVAFCSGLAMTGLHRADAQQLFHHAQDRPSANLEDLSIETASAEGPLRFRIEVARTPHQKAYGLMFRRNLPSMTGMLFPYEGEQTVSMWMRNTYIPLDMLFIKADGEIHRIEAMTEPFSERIISSGEPVSAVLEIAGGDAARLGIAAGDKVRHPHFLPR